MQSKSLDPQPPLLTHSAVQTKEKIDSSEQRQLVKLKEDIKSTILEGLTNEQFLKEVKDELLQSFNLSAPDSCPDPEPEHPHSEFFQERIKRKFVRRIYKELNKNYEL
jgi:hypothetical protein